jgi:protein TonB
LKSGHPLLVNAAKEAVLQWRYRPTILNGEPVEVISDIIVNFTLSQ